MNSTNMHSVAPDKLAELLSKDMERMNKVTEAVTAAEQVLTTYATTETELAYMRYKTGARLMLETLEVIDQALLAEQLSPELSV